MTRVEGKGVVIDRSVDDVWRFMTDISNMPQWEENQADWKQTSEGPIDSGTTFQIMSRPSIGRPFGWEMKTNLRITEFEPNRKFATEATSGFLEGTKISYLMEPVEGDKTRLSRVTGFVQAWARSAADARAVQHDTGIEDNEWWATSGPMLARVHRGRSQLCHAISEPRGHGRTREDTTSSVIEYGRTPKEPPGYGRTRRCAGSGP